MGRDSERRHPRDTVAQRGEACDAGDWSEVRKLVASGSVALWYRGSRIRSLALLAWFAKTGDSSMLLVAGRRMLEVGRTRRAELALRQAIAAGRAEGRSLVAEQAEALLTGKRGVVGDPAPVWLRGLRDSAFDAPAELSAMERSRREQGALWDAGRAAHLAALLLAYRGRVDEALQAASRAVEVSPVPEIVLGLAVLSAHAGRRRASEAAQREAEEFASSLRDRATSGRIQRFKRDFEAGLPIDHDYVVDFFDLERLAATDPEWRSAKTGGP